MAFYQRADAEPLREDGLRGREEVGGGYTRWRRGSGWCEEFSGRGRLVVLIDVDALYISKGCKIKKIFI